MHHYITQNTIQHHRDDQYEKVINFRKMVAKRLLRAVLNQNPARFAPRILRVFYDVSMKTRSLRFRVSPFCEVRNQVFVPVCHARPIYFFRYANKFSQ